ncbi:MAG: tetratricopeptide repeat protein [Gammaproteobacteria bacterium]|nr:tetratricopeptide repeat protein [Gammaproteobacteria bacterium]
MVSVSATLEDAQTLYEQGRNTEALAEVERVLAMRPKDAEARFLKGIIYAESGDSSGAIEVFAGLTQDFPELPEPWNNLAVLFAENGEFDKARESLLAAIQTHPSYSTAHENLGDLYARMAGMAYDRALEQDRGNESARLKLSAVNGLFAAPRIPSSDPQPAATVAAATPPPVQQPTATEPPPQAASSTVPPPAVETEPEVSTPEPAPTPVVAATTTAPAPVSQTPPPAVEDASEDLVAAVRNWAAAWSGQNVDQYLASYSPNFTPSNGASYRAWASYRRERLTKPKVIEVELSDIQVEQIDENTATVSFGQKYRSDNYRDEVTKTLTLNKANGSWRIVAEVSE